MFQFDVRISGNGGVGVSTVFWGAHAPSHAVFGTSPKTIVLTATCHALGEGAKRCTRGACAPQTVRLLI
jgi:hypothetical protein